MRAWKLVHLRDDGSWDSLDERNWSEQLEEIAELHFVRDTPEWPESLQARGFKRLDWWVSVLQLTLQELRTVIGPRPNYAKISEDWDQPFRDSEAAQNALLDSLTADRRYGLLWVDLD